MADRSILHPALPHRVSRSPQHAACEAGLLPEDSFSTATASPQVAAPNPALRYRRILLAGPVKLDVDVLQAALAQHNCSAYFDRVSTAARAIAQLLDRGRPRPSAIVLSEGIPGGDPLDLLQLLRARRELRTVPVFVQGETDCHMTSRRLYAHGVNGYLIGERASEQLAASLLQFETLAGL